nr:hypothetical protein [Tanacetum cinerariifolium]
MKDKMFDLVKICHHKQFLCIHDDVDDIIESALDSKLLSINSINSQRLDEKEQEVKIVEDQPAERRNLTPILSTKEPENSLSMGYKHLSITPETESDEVTESNAENLLPIPRECEIPPGIENVADDPEGDVRFLEELLIDDSILSHESFDFNFKNNPSISRSPPEPPDDKLDLEPEVISAVMKDIDEPDEHFDPGREINISTKIEDDDYFPFMFVIRFFLPYFIFLEISPLLLFAESEDTIFDP